MRKTISVKRTLLTAAVIAALVTTFVIAAHVQTKQQKHSVTSPPGNSENRVAWQVAKAKREGRSSIDLPALSVMHADIQSVDQALKANDVIYGQVINSYAVSDANSGNISTYYKLRILETLSTASIRSGESPFDKLPASLEPNRGEFVVLLQGGTMTLDGVKVNQAGISLKQGSRYLIFAQLKSNGLASQTIGSAGVFEEINGTLQGLSPLPHPLTKYVLDNKASLNQVKENLHRRERN